MTVKITPLGQIKKALDVELQNRFLAILLLVIGSVFLYYGLSIVGQGIAASGWNQTKATIVHSDLDKKWVSGVDSKGRIEWKREYSADIAYTYLVDFKQYRSNKIGRYKTWDSIEDEQERILKRYPKWTEVDVYYDSLDPSNAMLEPNLVIMDFFASFLGTVFLILGAILLIKK